MENNPQNVFEKLDKQGEQTLQMNGIDAYFNVGYYHISVPDYVLRSLVYEIRKYGLCTEYVTMELFSLTNKESNHIQR